jgi:hypothetical protein
MTEKHKKNLLAIAKDALKTMGRYKVGHGKFVAMPGLKCDALGDELQKHLPQIEKKKRCQVCADGMLFISAVRLFDRFKIDSELVDILGQGFEVQVAPGELLGFLEKKIGANATRLIETAFETGGGFYYDASKPGYHAAVSFGNKYSGATKRLEAILKNIIRNKGEFRPKGAK